MNEFEMMKNNPKELLNYYMNLLTNGIVLNEEQIIKFEYLKKLLIKE